MTRAVVEVSLSTLSQVDDCIMEATAGVEDPGGVNNESIGFYAQLADSERVSPIYCQECIYKLFMVLVRLCLGKMEQ